MVKINSETYKLIQQTKMPKLAEKDMLECLILEELFEDQYISENFVFSGGASINKSYNLTQRPCEDIDLVCRDFTELPENRSPKQFDKFKRNFKDFVFSVIQPKVNYIINQNQQFMIVTDRDWKALSRIAKHQSSPTLHVFYKSEFGTDLGHLSIEVIPRIYDDNIVSCRHVMPYSTKQAMGKIPTVAAEQTFWDKINALHSNTITDKPHFTRHYSRHYYDVAKISENVNLNATQNMFGDVIKYQQRYTTKKIDWAESVKDVNLIPQETVLKKLEQDYNSLAETFLETPESWDQIVDVLVQLQQRINTL